MIDSFLQPAGNWLVAILGISFLIFVHELGHFVAARMFAVRVEVFSIGFGPRLFGRRRGATDYRVSAIPLGGYVKMAGEYGDLPDDETVGQGDLMSKPVWQRLIVFLAGPLSNLVLAFVLFPLAFGGGVPFLAPRVGDVEPGGPAWKAGVQPGDLILEVNGNRIYGFGDVILEVALGDPQANVLRVRRQGREIELVAQPRRSEGRWELGISQAFEVRVAADGAAATAGLRDDAIWLAVNGLSVGEPVLGDVRSASEALLLAMREGGPLELRVESEGVERTLRIEPLPLPEQPVAPRLGALPLATRVVGLRGAAETNDFPLAEGDVVVAAGDRLLTRPEDVQAAALSGSSVLLVYRAGSERPVELRPNHLRALLDGDVAFGSDDSGTRRVRPTTGGSLAEAGLLPGDEILSLNARAVRNFDALRAIVDDDAEQIDYIVRYRHGEEERQASVRARAVPALDYGLGILPVQVIHDLSILEAIRAGLDASVNALRTTGLTLSKLFTGELSAGNLGGPLQIGWITYQAARLDLTQLLFFLALLSVNLGFINILPIPVLDGGQVMFLLCEKIKGSRLSERFLQSAQLVGFVAIMLLMVFVTVNDILKLWG